MTDYLTNAMAIEDKYLFATIAHYITSESYAVFELKDKDVPVNVKWIFNNGVMYTIDGEITYLSEKAKEVKALENIYDRDIKRELLG